jgi:D-alanyl-lipoteichoic acid acyltransferase DltB (MBOAT superfamily)
MTFTSFNFWLIFPLIFVIYWLIPVTHNKIRNIFLLIVSYLLYLNWKPAFALALLGVTIICFGGGYLLDIQRVNKRKAICIVTTLLGLLPLIIFKYYNFINDSATDLLEMVGLHFSLPGLNWAIPVGISFFTFQAVGYVLDVYKQRVPAERNFLDFALFVSFFPQVTSGPISTAAELMPQIKTAHTFRYVQGRDGLKLLLWGMFLKLALADRIGVYVDTVYTNYIHYSGAVCYFASIMYTIQIYCDFAGYSFMAIGIAKTLGFDLINNFERPYLAASVTEFWKRWHISLTRWLTTHVYINLGGNRCSKLRQYFNILVTFLVSGLWHGANWTFVVWGALHGFFQIIEKMFAGDKIKAELKQNKIKLSVTRVIRIIITFNLVSLAWIFFRMPTIGNATTIISRIFTQFGKFTIDPLVPVYAICIALCLPLLIFKDLCDEYLPNALNHRALKWIFYVIIASFTISLGILDCGQFIYVNF